MSVLRHTRWGSAVGRSSTRTQAGAVAEPRGRRPPHRRPRGEGGFTLIEMMVALTLVTVVMAALTVLFVNTMSSVSHLRTKQVATSVASSAIDKARGLGALGSDAGRDSSSVTVQFASTVATSPAVSPWLTGMTAAADTAASPGQGQTACSASNPTGRCADLPTVPVVQSINGQSFSTSYLVGTCWRVGTDTSTSATCSTTKPTGAVQYYKVVVAVSWTDNDCAANICYFVTAVLLNGLSDPTFNFNSTPPAKPNLTGCTNQTVVVGDVINIPVIKQQTTDTTFVCALSGGVPPFTWTASGLPSGVTLDQTGHFVGTVGTPTGTKTSTVTATDAFLRSNTGPSFTWTVNPGVTVTPAPTPVTASMVNSKITNVTFTAAGGLGSPYSWTASGLPAGVTLVKASNTTATLSGTPTAFGAFNVIVTAIDTAGSHSATYSYAWNVYPPLTVTNPSNQISTATMPISPLPLPVSGGSGSYTITDPSKTLPSWLQLSGDSTSGYSLIAKGSPPSTTGATTIKLTVTDSAPVVPPVSFSFSWTVAAQPSITQPGNQTTKVGVTVALPLTSTCSNGPCTYTAANLPPWLTLNASNGTISGPAPLTVSNPPNADVWAGITVTVTDKSNAFATTTPPFTWTVVLGPTAANPGNQASVVGQSVSLQLTAACPNGGCNWTATGLPNGLTISSAGLVAGSPAKVGPFSVVAKVTDSKGQTDTVSFTWTVTSNLALVIPDQVSGRGARVTLGISPFVSNASGTFTFAPSGLPSWLTYNSASQTLSGTTPNNGNSKTTIAVTVTDGAGAQASDTFNWWVSNLQIAAQNQSGKVGANWTVNLASWVSGGTGPYSYAIDQLPAGVTLSGSTITAIPSAVGTTTSTLTVTDSTGAFVTATFSWAITAPSPLTLSIPNQTTEQFSTVSLNVAALTAGGVTPYSWAVTVGMLPTGLSLNAATGVISGIPTVAQAATSVTVTVTDYRGVQTSSTFAWTAPAWSGTIQNENNSRCLRYNSGNLSLSTNCAATGTTWALDSAGLLHLSGSTAACLQAANTNNGAPTMVTCNSTVAAQRWTYNPTADTLSNAANSYVLAISSSNAVQVQTNTGSTRQQWTLN